MGLGVAAGPPRFRFRCPTNACANLKVSDFFPWESFAPDSVPPDFFASVFVPDPFAFDSSDDDELDDDGESSYELDDDDDESERTVMTHNFGNDDERSVVPCGSCIIV